MKDKSIEQLPKEKYSWQKVEDNKYYVWHTEGDNKTLIAITDDAEKAHFLAKAANGYKAVSEDLEYELRETAALRDSYAKKIVRQYQLIEELKSEIQRLHEQQLDVDWEIEADEAGLDKETQEEIIAMANATIKASDEHKEYVRNLEIENGILRNHVKELKAAAVSNEPEVQSTNEADVASKNDENINEKA